MKLFPPPQKAQFDKKKRDLSSASWMILPSDADFALKKRSMEMAKEYSKSFLHKVTVTAGLPSAGETLLVMKRKKSIAPQGYSLTLVEKGPIELAASCDCGFYYGLLTLAQILKTPAATPLFAITDKPDLGERGYMLDISRTKVPTMATLKEMIKSLSRLRYNSIQLYMEHTFAFAEHERVWADFSPMTSEEIMELDAYCHEYFMELVPNLNSFGHLNRFLRFEEYRHLAECDPPFIHISGMPMQGVLAPNDAALKFMEKLYKEFLPNFTSRKINIGCDETVELGKGRSREICEKKGEQKVYLEFLNKLNSLAGKEGFAVEFWGDIIVKSPELIPLLPKGITGLVWGYEPTSPFDKNTEAFKKAGIDFLVCPGASTWGALLGRVRVMVENIRNGVVNCQKNGGRGLLLTDWGDGGHHQYLPISFPGITMAGGISWNVKAKVEEDLSRGIAFAFLPDAPDGEKIGDFLWEIGTVNDDFTERDGNSTPFGNLFAAHPRRKKSQEWCLYNRLKIADVKKAIAHIEKLLVTLRQNPFSCALINAELENNLRLARVALLFIKRAIADKTWDQGAWKDELRHVIACHRDLWLARNRPGGLQESSDNLRKGFDFDPDEWKNK